MVELFSAYLNGISVFASEAVFGAVGIGVLFMTVIVAIFEVIRP